MHVTNYIHLLCLGHDQRYLKIFIVRLQLFPLSQTLLSVQIHQFSTFTLKPRRATSNFSAVLHRFNHATRLAVYQVDLRDRCVAGIKSRYIRESRWGSNGSGSVRLFHGWPAVAASLARPPLAKVVRYVARVTLHTTKVGEWTEKSMASSSPPRLRFSTFVSRLISRELASQRRVHSRVKFQQSILLKCKCSLSKNFIRQISIPSLYSMAKEWERWEGKDSSGEDLDWNHVRSRNGRRAYFQFGPLSFHRISSAGAACLNERLPSRL